MGEVYRAGDPKIGRDVAIKVLPADLSVEREEYVNFSGVIIFAVTVEETGGALKVGTPKALFKTMIEPIGGIGTRASYDATRDGSRFFVTEQKKDPAADTQPVTVLVNWQSIVKKR